MVDECATVAVLALRADRLPLNRTPRTVDTRGGACAEGFRTNHGSAAHTVALVTVVIGGAFVAIVALALEEFSMLKEPFHARVHGAGVAIVQGQGFAENTLATQARIAHGAVRLVVIADRTVFGGWVLAIRIIRFGARTCVIGAGIIVETRPGDSLARHPMGTTPLIGLWITACARVVQGTTIPVVAAGPRLQHLTIQPFDWVTDTRLARTDVHNQGQSGQTRSRLITHVPLSACVAVVARGARQ